MKISKKMHEKVSTVGTIIEQSIRDEVSGIEVDSTWETSYDFRSIKLLKTRLIVCYSEWDGVTIKERRDSIKLSDIEAVNYTLSWIRRCIRKGYKQNSN